MVPMEEGRKEYTETKRVSRTNGMELPHHYSDRAKLETCAQQVRSRKKRMKTKKKNTARIHCNKDTFPFYSICLFRFLSSFLSIGKAIKHQNSSKTLRKKRSQEFRLFTD